MTDDRPDVRELKLTKLGPGKHEATLRLTESSLIIETPDDSPIPAWLRGEIAFDDLDIVYVDPAHEPEADEGAGEQEATPPGFRLVRWIEIANEETGESYQRQATMAFDEGHLDIEQAEAFALTFAALAGREIPEKAPEEAPPEEAPAGLPTGAPEPVAAEAEAEPEPAAFARPEDDTPAFARPDDSE